MADHPRTAQKPPQRPAPRPLPLHLLTQLSILNGSRSALPLLKAGSLPWNPSLQDKARQLSQNLQNAGPNVWIQLDRAIALETMRRHQSMLDGIDAYRRHAYHRPPTQKPVLWRQGSTRLWDYRSPAAGGGVPVLVVPSLVNRAYILDLTPRHSLMAHLAESGMRPFLLDWDAPGPDERDFALDHYIQRLDQAVQAVQQACDGRSVALIGYCMGGDLALAAALRQPDRVAALAMLATPWDFQAGNSGHGAMMRALEPTLRPLLRQMGQMPVDLLQAMFASLDPTLAGRKFAAFARMDLRTTQARDFVALEDWANDGVPLTAAVASQCLFGWYGANDTVAGRWLVQGQAIRPETLTIPCLCMVPQRDRIVPPVSALPLGQAIQGAEIRMIHGGHVGMLLSERSRDEVYAPLVHWIQGILGEIGGCAVPRRRTIKPAVHSSRGTAPKRQRPL